MSTLRRSASTLSITKRAPAMSGLARLLKGGGVCCSSCWFSVKLAILPNAPTAASGVRKVGICALCSTSRAAPTVVSPIQQVSNGLAARRLASATASATAVLSMPMRGEKMTNTPPTCASFKAASMASRKCSGWANSETSTKSLKAANGGNWGASWAATSGLRRPSSRWISLTQSAASTPGPPPLAMMARRLLTGR